MVSLVGGQIIERLRFCVLNQNELIEVGGVILTPESIESATSTPKMTGSMLIIQAANIEAVKKVVETDIYYTTGVVGLLFGGK